MQEASHKLYFYINFSASSNIFTLFMYLFMYFLHMGHVKFCFEAFSVFHGFTRGRRWWPTKTLLFFM